MRRRVTGKAEKLQPYAVFGGGTFPHAASLPGPGLLRTARPGRLRAVTLPQGLPFAKGARRKCYYDPVAAGAALVGGLRLGCPRLGRSTIRLRCVRVCGPGTAAHLCPAVQRSQAFCFEGLGSVKATGTGCPLPCCCVVFVCLFHS